MLRKTILIFMFSVLVFEIAISQDRILTGKIIDYRGMPIAGVNIIDKDYPSLATISGVDGQFRLSVFNFTKILQFSFNGMKDKEVVLTDANELLIVLDYLPWENPHPWSIAIVGQVNGSDVYSQARYSDSVWDCSGAPAVGINIEMDYFFSQKIGLSTGLSVNQYRSKAWLDNFDNYGTNTLRRMDKDNEMYYLYNYVSNVFENTYVSSVSVPLSLKYRLRPDKNWDFFIKAGVKFIYVLKAHIKAEGQSEWQGYYPAYHVVLYDVPEYGFTVYDINYDKEIQDYNNMLFSFISSLGISKRMGKRVNFELSTFYEQGINDLNYSRPVYEADFLNTVGKVDKTLVRALGFMLGFRYNFVSNRK